MDEVTEFLNTVKNEADTEGQFTTQISKEAGHISGIYTAQLTEVDPEENTEVIPEETLADQVSAGANGAFTYQMEYAMANPRDDSYETGTIGMEFIERVEVYEKYISGDALSDVETQVEEVTKEKETNKIYVVESGDVLSVIAMDHDTTVANIMALNGFDNAEVRIYPGQEIIIAVPEPDLSLRIKKGEVYEEDYNAEPTIIKNDEWYTTKQVVHQEGTTGHRERNDIVTYENGIEVARELAHETIMVESTPAIIEQGTITPPTYIKPLAGGHFTSGFGRRWGRMHKGVDWGCPVGTTVYVQEDKEGVFDAVDTLKMCLPVFTRMVDTMTINKDNMRNAARKGFMNATDAADWLVKQGVPFRDAHAIIGQLVLYSINNNKNLDDLTLDEYKAVSDVFTEDIYKAIDLDTCVNTRTVPGGPSEAYIKSLIELNKKCIENLK